ncbi:MAG: hypothetical protein KAI83_08155 [Thiomargarita sp.]|nr:hypothetical protein [Thiomargarita sp.]
MEYNASALSDFLEYNASALSDSKFLVFQPLKTSMVGRVSDNVTRHLPYQASRDNVTRPT